MLRTFAHANCEEMARHACIPVINALSDYSHPCQAMADYLTMFEVKGRVKGLKVAFLGDGNNVARSLMFAGALLGAEVYVATPPGYAPDNAAMEWAKSHAAHSGGMCVVTQNPQEAAFHADVVYTDVWASMGQESEAAERAQDLPPVSGQRKALRPGQAGCHLPALPARAPRPRGDRRGHGFAAFLRLPAGGEPPARAEGNSLRHDVQPARALGAARSGPRSGAARIAGNCATDSTHRGRRKLADPARRAGQRAGDGKAPATHCRRRCPPGA